MTENKQIFRELETKFSRYSEVEKKIARFLLEAPEQFIRCSMPELAEKAGVSQGSIGNFAKKYFGVGFAALKIQVAQQLSHAGPQAAGRTDDPDDAKSTLRKNIDRMELAFKNVYDLNTAENLEKATDMILQAKKIDLYGVFLSGVAARHLQYLLLRQGFPVQYISDGLLSPVSATTLGHDSLVIAISHSGKTTNVIEPVKIAKNNGAGIVAITATPDSALARLADVVLLASCSPDTSDNILPEVEFTQMLLCNSICEHLRHKVNKDSENRYSKLQNIISSQNIVD